MAKQARLGFIVLLLSILVLSAACTPVVGAGNDVLPDGTDPVHGTPRINVVVDEIELHVMESFPIQVAAVVRGYLPDGCTVLDGISAAREGNAFALDIGAHREGDMCTMALVPFEERVALDVVGLEAGTYRVTAGDALAEFTFDVDNVRADGASVEYVRDLRGTVTAIVYGTDGVQVELTAGDTVYSVTISALRAEVEGGWDRIEEQSEIVVSGPVDAGMSPPLVLAERVTVLGREEGGVLSGEVVVRDATGVVELPAGTTVTVRLADISRQDVRAVVLGERVYEVEQLPLRYELSYDAGAIDERVTYAVSARVHDAAGRLLFLTDTVHPALTRGAGTTITARLVAIK